MYSRIPCGLPSATTPITADSLSNNAKLIGQAMDAAQEQQKSLVLKLGGVWPGASVWGDTAAGGGAGSGSLKVSVRPGLPPACGGVILEPYPGAYMPPAPVLTQPAPARVLTPVQARAVEQPAAAPAIPAQDPGICKNITADTVCEAAMRGCFAAGQVDPAQLAACAAAGWQGNLNQFPYVVARGGADGGRRVGLINPNPAGPGGRRSEAPWMGLSGLSCGGGRCSGSAGSAGSTAATVAIAALGLGALVALVKGARG